MGRVVMLLLLGLLAACAGRPAAVPPPLRVTAVSVGADTRLTLHAEPALKINARLAPALEMADGTTLRFRSSLLTADSAYFAEPPSVVVRGQHPPVHGTLRASICADDEQVCRAVTVKI